MLYAPLLWPDEPNYCVELNVDIDNVYEPYAGICYQISSEGEEPHGLYGPDGKLIVRKKIFGFVEQ